MFSASDYRELTLLWRSVFGSYLFWYSTFIAIGWKIYCLLRILFAFKSSTNYLCSIFFNILLTAPGFCVCRLKQMNHTESWATLRHDHNLMTRWPRCLGLFGRAVIQVLGFWVILWATVGLMFKVADPFQKYQLTVKIPFHHQTMLEFYFQNSEIFSFR